jgi:putative membrane protein
VPAPALDDAAIFAMLEKANTAEIELGDLAARMGQSAEVKDLGKTFAAAHTQARQKARDLAKKVNITPALPSEPMKDMKDSTMKHPDKETYDAAMNRLKGLKGTEFDVAFIAKEIAHHQRMIDAVDNKFLPAAKNAELKQLLTELKPSLQSHLDQARALEKKLALGN